MPGCHDALSVTGAAGTLLRVLLPSPDRCCTTCKSPSQLLRWLGAASDDAGPPAGCLQLTVARARHTTTFRRSALMPSASPSFLRATSFAGWQWASPWSPVTPPVGPVSVACLASRPRPPPRASPSSPAARRQSQPPPVALLLPAEPARNRGT